MKQFNCTLSQREINENGERGIVGIGVITDDDE